MSLLNIEPRYCEICTAPLVWHHHSDSHKKYTQRRFCSHACSAASRRLPAHLKKAGQRRRSLKYYYGHKAVCSERTRRYHAAHPEQRRSTVRRWRCTHPERDRALRLIYYWRNPAKFLARCRAWAQVNAVHIRLYGRRYYALHRDRVLTLQHIRKARKRGAPRNDLTAAQWREIKAHYGHCCVYCGQQSQRLTMDHLTPLARGGSHTASNVVPACKRCNSRKHAGPVLSPVQPLLLTVASPRASKKGA